MKIYTNKSQPDPLDVDYHWNKLSKIAYWDRDVSLSQWKKMIKIGHPSYLFDAVKTFKVPQFIYFLGVNNFKLLWPKLLSVLPSAYLKYTGMYDVVWSQLVGGGYNLEPTLDLSSMPQKRFEFLLEVARHPGGNVYQIAKNLNVQYRRAYEHAKNLIRDKKIRGIMEFTNGKNKLRLYPLKRAATV